MNTLYISLSNTESMLQSIFNSCFRYVSRTFCLLTIICYHAFSLHYPRTSQSFDEDAAVTVNCLISVFAITQIFGLTSSAVSQLLLQPVWSASVQFVQEFGQSYIMLSVVVLEITACSFTHLWVGAALSSTQTLVHFVVHHLTEESFPWIIPVRKKTKEIRKICFTTHTGRKYFI